VELKDFLSALRKRWLSVVLAALLGVAAGLLASVLAPERYTATTQLYVSVQGGDTTSDLLQGSNFTQQQVSSYTKIVASPLVLNPVIDQLGLGERADVLAESVSADSPINTSLININVSAANPAIAAATADAIADQFKDVVGQLETPTNGTDSAVKVSVVRPAAAPTEPSSPNVRLNVALGLLLGLAVGTGLAILREVLDTRVRNADDVARVTDTSVIGAIGFDEDAPRHPLIVQTSPHSQRSEAFRRLRTNLQFLDIADRPHSIVVTSSLPGEGKSTTAINVAITLADAGSRVALVDADLRRPSVAKYMGLEGSAGLTTVLIGRATLDDVIQPWGNGQLHVLPSGQVPPNPSELLGSTSMAQLLQTLTDRYDMVVVDTPPLLPVTDAAILAKLTGGALVVVGADKLHRNQLGESVGALETVGARILGIVLNRQPRKQSDSYAYYDYAPGSGAGGSTGRKGRKRRRRPTSSRTAGTSATAGPTTPDRTPEESRPTSSLFRP
jgi:capsular exopolysaccharide synthesis family protein